MRKPRNKHEPYNIKNKFGQPGLYDVYRTLIKSTFFHLILPFKSRTFIKKFKSLMSLSGKIVFGNLLLIRRKKINYTGKLGIGTLDTP